MNTHVSQEQLVKLQNVYANKWKQIPWNEKTKETKRYKGDFVVEIRLESIYLVNYFTYSTLN
jgi:hypothetical protein